MNAPSTATAASPPAPAPLFVLRGHEAPVNCLQFEALHGHSESGSHAPLLLSGASDGVVMLWDVERRRSLHHMAAYSELGVLAVHFLDADSILTQGNDGFVKLFSAGRDDKPFLTLSTQSYSFCKAWPVRRPLSTPSLLVTPSEKPSVLTLWDLKSAKIVQRINCEELKEFGMCMSVRQLPSTPFGSASELVEHALAVSGEGGHLGLWDLRNGKKVTCVLALQRACSWIRFLPA